MIWFLTLTTTILCEYFVRNSCVCTFVIRPPHAGKPSALRSHLINANQTSAEPSANILCEQSKQCRAKMLFRPQPYLASEHAPDYATAHFDASAYTTQWFGKRRQTHRNRMGLVCERIYIRNKIFGKCQDRTSGPIRKPNFVGDGKKVMPTSRGEEIRQARILVSGKLSVNWVCIWMSKQ